MLTSLPKQIKQASGTELRKKSLPPQKTHVFLSDTIQEISPPVQPQLASAEPIDEPSLLATKNQKAVFEIAKESEKEPKTLEEQFVGETQIPRSSI